MREVIDLLSSPDLPRPVELPVKGPAKGLALLPSKAERSGWIDLSSDPFELESSTALEPTSKVTAAHTELGATSIIPASKPLPNNPMQGNWNFEFLSDDFDSTVNLDESTVTVDEDPFVSPQRPPKKSKVSWMSSYPSGTLKGRSMVPKTAGYKRTVSNIESSTRPSASRSTSLPSLQRTTSSNAKLESDPIQFTSSPDPFADAAKRRKRRKQETLYEEENEDDLGDTRRSSIGKASNIRVYGIDDDSAEDFPDIAAINTLPSIPPTKVASQSKSSRLVLDKYNEDRAKEKAKVAAAKAKGEKGNEKKDKAQEKKAKKDAEDERKRLVKEDKFREKLRQEEINKVNTLKTDKKVSTPQMIVDLPSSMGRELVIRVQKLLDPMSVEHTEWESGQLRVVKWRRKVVAEYHSELDRWDPIPQIIRPENHVMCILNASEFVDLATGPEGQDIDAHILRLKLLFEGCQVMYMMQGIKAWMMKNKNIKNRQFAAAVRSHANQDAAPLANQRARKKKVAEYVDEDLIEDALLRLQITHGVKIHHTMTEIETAEWVLIFTQHISTIPYRQQKHSLDTQFCMESGQVKTGEDAADTYIKMLQENARVTASIAYGIHAEYPSVRKLVEGLESEGPLALEDCRKSSNKDGAFSDKRVGPAISKRIHKVYLGRDPGSFDI